MNITSAQRWLAKQKKRRGHEAAMDAADRWRYFPAAAGDCIEGMLPLLLPLRDRR